MYTIESFQHIFLNYNCYNQQLVTLMLAGNVFYTFFSLKLTLSQFNPKVLSSSLNSIYKCYQVELIIIFKALK